MDRKYILLGGVLLLVLILGVVFPRPITQVVEKVKKSIGAISGPDIYSPYLRIDEVEQRYFSSKFSNASTTLCSFRTPDSTSTLVFGSAQITTATSSATAWTLGKSTLPDATTTSLGDFTIASGAKGTMIASTTSSDLSVGGLDPDYVFAPSTYFNVKGGGWTGTLTKNSLKGTCKAKFIVN